MFNKTPIDVFGLNKVGGDVGIEIEAELQYSSDNYPLNGFKKNWKLESDGSLKVNGVEFVLKNPVSFNKVPKTLGSFRAEQNKQDMVFRESFRAGVHIHVNMQKHTLLDIMRYAVVYYAMETMLTHFCGEGRENNQFCLRAKDAEFVLQAIEKSLEENNINYLQTDALRYSALNFQSLFKYGSVEYRGFATTPNLNNLEEWVDIIHKIKTYSLGLKSIWNVASDISADGPQMWVSKVLGEEHSNLLKYDGVEQDIMSDLRRVQTIMFLISEKEG